MNQGQRRPVVIVIRDGWGENPYPQWNHANAVHLAKKPVADRLMREFPHTLIHTSGEDVGLPAGVMGNSEVGHQNIGAGRIVDQEVMRITRAIREGQFFRNPVLQGAIAHVKQTGGSLHLLGLMSDGRVHSDLDHALAVVELARREGLEDGRFWVHAITDGRDTSPTSSIEFVSRLEQAMQAAGVGRVSSVVGRYYAMDRDLRWDRVELAYRLLTQGAGRTAATPREGIQSYYDHPTEPNRQGDEFITPVLIAATGTPDPRQLVRSGDAVIFLNFRGDRTRELTKAFVLPDDAWRQMAGGGFTRGARLERLYFATMTGYEQGLPVEVIFEKQEKMPNILGEYVSRLGLRQFRSAETEKYPHVTFFFNDYRDEPFPLEDRCLVPSPRDVSTYDQKPEMSAYGVTDQALRAIQSGQYDLVVINYANGDMVGHTGSLPAAIRAVEVVDECVGKIVDATLAQGGSLIVTADHGNCEQMIDPETGGPHTAHTTYDVPLIVVHPGLDPATPLRSGGRLADIAPTALALMGLPLPDEMTGQPLLSLPGRT